MIREREIVKRLVHGRERPLVRLHRGEIHGGDGRGRRTGAGLLVHADDRVLRGDLVVRHLNRTVPGEHRLEPVRRRRPREILDAARRLGQRPGDDDAIGQFFDEMRARHARFQEDADCRVPVHERLRGVLQLVEPSDRHAAAEANRARRVDVQRVPRAAGERKREVAQRHGRPRRRLAAELRVPRERRVLDAIAAGVRPEAQRLPAEIEKIRPPERVFVEREDDEIAFRRNRSDRLAGRRLPVLFDSCRDSDGGGKRDETRHEARHAGECMPAAADLRHGCCGNLRARNPLGSSAPAYAQDYR